MPARRPLVGVTNFLSTAYKSHHLVFREGSNLLANLYAFQRFVAFASVLMSKASSTAHQFGQREIPLKTLRPRHHYYLDEISNSGVDVENEPALRV